MSKEIDLVNRDPNDMNNFLQVDFEDVLAEPSGAHAMDCAWTNSYKCFTCGKNLCYQLMTCLCGMCIALYWGCFRRDCLLRHLGCYSWPESVAHYPTPSQEDHANPIVHIYWTMG